MNFMRKVLHAGKMIAYLCAIGLTLLLCGCATNDRPSPGLSAEELRNEFEACVVGASSDFVQGVAEAAAELEAEVAHGFDQIERGFVQLCLDTDGYVERSKGLEESRRKLEDYVRVAVTELLQENLSRYSERYSDNLALLENRLLVTIPLRSKIEQQVKDHEWLIAHYAPQPEPERLRGSATVKIVDDTFGWVPVVGDAYDLAKLTIYDPRESAMKERASAYIDEQRQYWMSQVHKLALGSLSVKAVEKECRQHFDPKLAIKRLEAE